MKASKKTHHLRDKSVDELATRERELREQLFKLRFQRATGRMENPIEDATRSGARSRDQNPPGA